ncbi:hypothetical protein [uncultured Methylobacterium sp.]|uniref:hypothetical protein n=1 Tax=uncultured Methylobacterium sp. TaxID=157278 RepID=UPI0035C9F490
MKNVSFTTEDALLQRAQVAAVRDGKSVSRFGAEASEQRVGRPLSQREAIERILAGPSMSLTDENGKAPTRDELDE